MFLCNLMSGVCFPISNIEDLLNRMYNLSMHCSSLPLMDVPFSWMMHWSNTLEADLSQARLKAMVDKNKPKRR